AHLHGNSAHFGDLIDQMHWKPDHLILVCHRPLDRLLDPPGAVSTQLATLCRVKAFDGLHQTDVSFRNQIQEREPKIGVVMSDLNDQSEVCFDHQSPSLPVSPFNPRRQLNLLLWSQQRGLHDLSKVSFDDRIRILTSHIAKEKNLPCTAVIRKIPYVGKAEHST